MRITILRVVRPNIYRCLVESYCSHLSTVNMGAAFIEVSECPTRHNVRRHVSDDSHLHSHRNVKTALLRNLTSLCTGVLNMLMNYSRVILSLNNKV